MKMISEIIEFSSLEGVHYGGGWQIYQYILPTFEAAQSVSLMQYNYHLNWHTAWGILAWKWSLLCSGNIYSHIS